MAKKQNAQESLFAERFMNVPLDELVSDRFGRYAKYIIQDRALPDVRDGLKPVQRRILFAMSELGLTSDKPYKKSARTVGEVIGKYHPHGDSSIYEAMVRMAQDWKNNVPLIDMHGNKGSIDGDSPAAMRYTEARLGPGADLMLANKEKDTVKFVPNFDDSESEPTVLPALLPNMLVNGATGIAAGYATNMPPHNLSEVVDAVIARVDSPACRLETLLKHLPGPDFPTGGVIGGNKGVRAAYETGRGKISLAAKIAVESSKGAEALVVTEIPYETSKSSIVREIDTIRLDEKIQGIEDVRDESDRTGLRIVIEVKRGGPTDSIKNYLLKNTSLQVTYGINMVAVVDRKPVQISLPAALDAYIAHQLSVMVAYSKWDLAEAEKRREIVEGLIKAVTVLDDVVETIRRSKDKADAASALIERFALTANQAEAILQLRLHRLTSTSVEELRAELAVLVATIDELNALLASEDNRKNKLKSQLRAVKKTFGSPRKTVVEEHEQELVISLEATVGREDVAASVTRDGYIKVVSTRQAAEAKLEEYGAKEGDVPVAIASCANLDSLFVATDMGRYFNLALHKIPQTKWKDVGSHLNDLVAMKPGERVVYAEVSETLWKAASLAVATANGQIKRLAPGLLKSARPASLIKLGEGDRVVGVVKLAAPDSVLAVVTRRGYALSYPAAEVSELSTNAAGVKAIALDDDHLAALLTVANDEQVVLGASQGYKRLWAKELAAASRGSKGKPVVAQLSGTPIAVFGAVTANAKTVLALASQKGEVAFIKASEVPLADGSSRMSGAKVKPLASIAGLDWESI